MKAVPSVRIPYTDRSIIRRRHAQVTSHSKIRDFVFVADQRSQILSSTKIPDFGKPIIISRDDKFGPSDGKSSDMLSMAFYRIEINPNQRISGRTSELCCIP